MKKYICVTLSVIILALASCLKDEEIDSVLNSNDRVILSLKTMAGTITRSADSEPEEKIEWVDVFVMKEDSTIYHMERIDISTEPVYKQGEFVLEKKRGDFVENEKYFVYIIANAQLSFADYDEVADWNDLKTLIQENQNIHLTGFVANENSDYEKGLFKETPKLFLMDGFAYMGENTPKQMTAYVLNDPDSKNVALNGILHRAAAKIVLNLTEGSRVKFDKSIGIPQYFYEKLPINTLVVASSNVLGNQEKVQTTDEVLINSQSFAWDESTENSETKTTIRITGYTYVADWSGAQAEKEPYLIVNLPMLWDDDEDGDHSNDSQHGNNWYKIPLSKEDKFERNTCYTINAKINHVGALEKSGLIELENIEFATQPWDEVMVNVGSEDSKVKYLILNTDLVKIYDSNIDEEQLKFYSSSPIKSVKLKDCYKHKSGNLFVSYAQDTLMTKDSLYVYYIDKHGDKTALGSDPGFDFYHLDGTKLDATEKAALLATEKLLLTNNHIRAEATPGELSGGITIFSPINKQVGGPEELAMDSHFNSIRYLEFEVTNEQGITATFRVEQYPLVYVENQQGFYSYRDDFWGYENGVAQPVTHFLSYSAYPYLTYVWYAPYGVQYFDETVNRWVWKDEYCEGYEARLKFGPIYHCGSNPQNPIIVYSREFGELSYEYFGVNETQDYERGGNQGWLGWGDRSNVTNKRCRWVVSKKNSHWKEIINGKEVTCRVAFIYYHMLDINENVKMGNGQTARYFADDWTMEIKEVFYANYLKDVYNGTSGKNQIMQYMFGPNNHYGERSVSNQDAMSSYKNPRMYKLNVTAVSDEYTLGIPKMIDDEGNYTDDRENGYTDPSLANSKVVSPSFMVASQLGNTTRLDFHWYDFRYETYSNDYVMENLLRPGMKENYYRIAKDQCKHYVEVYFEDANGDGKYQDGEPLHEYRDWRLPTKAEVDMIVKHQYISRTIDEVMPGQFYYCASPLGYTDGGKTGTEGFFIRAVRDNIDDSKTKSGGKMLFLRSYTNN